MTESVGAEVLTTKLRQAVEERDNMSAKCVGLKGELEELKSVFETMCKSVEMAQSELDASRAAIDEKSRVIKDLNSKLENKEGAATEPNMIESLTVSMNGQKEQIKLQVEKIEALNTSVREKDQKIAAIDAEIISVRDEHQLEKTSSTQKDSRITTLQNELQESQKKGFEQLSDKEGELMVLKSKIEYSERVLHAEIETEKQAFINLMNISEQNIANHAAEKHALQSQIQFMQNISNKLNEKEEEVRGLRAVIQDAIEESEIFKDEIKLKDGQICSLNEKLEACQRSLCELEGRCKSFALKVSEAERQVATLKTVEVDMSSELDKARSDIAAKNSEITALKLRMESTEDKSCDSRNQSNLLHIEIEELKAEVCRLKNTEKANADEQQSRLEELLQREEEIKILQVENAKSGAEVVALNDSKAEVANYLKKCKAKLAAKIDEISLLRNKLKSSEDRVSKASVHHLTKSAEVQTVSSAPESSTVLQKELFECKVEMSALRLEIVSLTTSHKVEMEAVEQAALQHLEKNAAIWQAEMDRCKEMLASQSFKTTKPMESQISMMEITPALENLQVKPKEPEMSFLKKLSSLFVGPALKQAESPKSDKSGSSPLKRLREE
jgi:chromosome segregation ATPase